MIAVDVRDFCIPSDENDYDELVAFADTMASIPRFDVLPIEVLDEIRAEIEQEYNRLSATRADETLEVGEYLGLKMSLKIIDKYKAERVNVFKVVG